MKRRDFIDKSLGFAALSGLAVLWSPFGAKEAQASGASQTQTPSQVEGPFYPRQFPGDADWNLLQVGDGTSLPGGTPLELTGRVLDQNGQGLAGHTVEIWQADSQGIYDHPDAGGTERFDRAFQGYGAVRTEANGSYRFLTLVPTPYTGRPPHIHVKVRRDGHELLTTQLYIRGHPENDRDGLLAMLFFRDQDKLLMDFKPAQLDGGLEGQTTSFDFVV